MSDKDLERRPRRIEKVDWLTAGRPINADDLANDNRARSTSLAELNRNLADENRI